MYQGSFNCVSRKFQEFFEKVSRVFLESFKDISRKIEGFFKGVSGVSRVFEIRCFKSVSRKLFQVSL